MASLAVGKHSVILQMDAIRNVKKTAQKSSHVIIAVILGLNTTHALL